jgi:DNA primase
MEEAKKDPVKKAELIRDIVNSISKIPDNIQQEVYLQECARIMDISENVLFSSLAQLNAKESRSATQQKKQRKSFDVVKEDENRPEKVDFQFELEKKIISILLLYGKEEKEFEDLVLKENKEGDIQYITESNRKKVFEKIYLDLQEDEISFANQGFQDLYTRLIEGFTKNGKLEIESFINEIEQEQSVLVSSLLMEDQKYELHNWESQNIFVKTKDEDVSRLVTETLLSFRTLLIFKVIQELLNGVQQSDNQAGGDTLNEIYEYNKLKVNISRRITHVRNSVFI